MEQIIFNLIKDSHHTWVRYFMVKEVTGITLPGEYVEIRSSFLDGEKLKGLLDVGFEIETIRSQKINADSYCDVLLKRGLTARPETSNPKPETTQP